MIFPPKAVAKPLFLLVLASGCVEERPFLAWDPRPPAPVAQGRVVAVPLRDARPPKQGGETPDIVGNNRSGWGIPFPVRLDAGVTVSAALSHLVGEAAATAGIGVTQPNDPAASAWLGGSIDAFWCDGYPPVYSARVELSIEVIDPATRQPRARVRVAQQNGGPSCQDAIRGLMNRAFDETVRVLADGQIHAAVLAPPALAPVAVAAAPVADNAPPDVVELQDGTSVSGRIVQQVPGQFVIVRRDGHDETLNWSLVKKIVASATPTPALVAPVPVYVPPPQPPGPDLFHAAESPATARRRRYLPLINAGAAVFAVSYGAALFTGVYGVASYGTSTPTVLDAYNAHCAEQLSYNIVPLVGPYIAAKKFADAVNPLPAGVTGGCGGGNLNGIWAGEILDGLFQLGGLAMIILGETLPAPHADAHNMAWTIVPKANAQGGGASFVWSF